jgi:hypothetical protein
MNIPADFYTPFLYGSIKNEHIMANGSKCRVVVFL